MSVMSERDSECRWTHWAIEYRNGDFSMVEWETMRSTRAEAWRAWERELEACNENWGREQMKHRRAGRYHAVKIAAHKFVQAAPAAASTKESA